MILNGYPVKHKTFGDGVVLYHGGHYITVEFSFGEKTFVYPDVFNGFLTIDDGPMEEMIAADLKKQAEEKAKHQAKRDLEKQNQMAKGVVVAGGSGYRDFTDRSGSHDDSRDSDA